MTKNYTDEFKPDVVAVAKQGAATRRQIAKDFGISKSALAVWARMLSGTSWALPERRLEGRPRVRGCGGRR
jgi:transposase